MATSLKVTLPLPPAELKPNSRPHHMAKANKVRAYRHSAFLAGIAARNVASHQKPWDAATVQVTYFVKDRRRRDRDNLLAALKAAFDGIADADVVADDSDMTYLPVKVMVDKADPRVEIEITPAFCEKCGYELEWYVTHECPPAFTEIAT